jgi:hypothetical protein
LEPSKNGRNVRPSSGSRKTKDDDTEIDREEDALCIRDVALRNQVRDADTCFRISMAPWALDR